MKRQTISKSILSLIFLLFFLSVVGCGRSLLPSGEEVVQSPWKTYEECKAAFDKIVPDKTDKKALTALGFDPYKIPNIKILSYVELMGLLKYDPSIKENLHEGVRNCIEAQNECQGYYFAVTNKQSQREGNFWMDILAFEQTTRETGWEFNALILMRKEMVVYKLWSGKPLVNVLREKRNPLGPFQSIGNAVPSRVP